MIEHRKKSREKKKKGNEPGVGPEVEKPPAEQPGDDGQRRRRGSRRGRRHCSNSSRRSHALPGGSGRVRRRRGDSAAAAALRVRRRGCSISVSRGRRRRRCGRLVARKLDPSPGSGSVRPCHRRRRRLRRRETPPHRHPSLPGLRARRRDHCVLHARGRNDVGRRHLSQKHRPGAVREPDLFGREHVRHGGVEAESRVCDRRGRGERLPDADRSQSQVGVVGLDRGQRLQVDRRELRGREGRDRHRWRLGAPAAVPGLCR